MIISCNCDTERMAAAQQSGPLYRERLIPGPGLFVALLLLIPAVALVMQPLNADLSIPFGIGSYVLAAVILLLLSPTIRVADGQLQAGRANISLAHLGDIELLGATALRAAIGPGADARNYLLIRGWIHRGISIAVTDPQDPTPLWVITSRKPVTLAEAIEAGKTARSESVDSTQVR